MLRLRLNELLAECNQNRDAGDRLHMQDVADAVGIPRSTLAVLTKFPKQDPQQTRDLTTNSAYLEALFRYFRRELPHFELSMLFEFRPSLDDTSEVRVDWLYPYRAEKGGRGPRVGEG